MWRYMCFSTPLRFKSVQISLIIPVNIPMVDGLKEGLRLNHVVSYYIPLHSIALHSTTSHYIPLHPITSHYIALYLNDISL